MKNANSKTQQFSTWQWLLLSSTPFLLSLIHHITINPLVKRLGLPHYFASFINFGILFELGFVIYLGLKLTGKFTLIGAVRYRELLPWWWYPLGFVVFLVIMFSITGAMVPVSRFLRVTIFTEMSASFGRFDASPFTEPVLNLMVFGVLIVMPFSAVIEELYFRGILLPRMEHLGWWGPLISAVFWAITHIGEPWDIPAWILIFLPLIFFTKWKKNVYMITFINGMFNLLNAIGLAETTFGG